jgi:hypothetical protein
MTVAIAVTFSLLRCMRALAVALPQKRLAAIGLERLLFPQPVLFVSTHRDCLCKCSTNKSK